MVEDLKCRPDTEGVFYACRYCGQLMTLPSYIAESSASEQEEYATVHCSCTNGMEYRLKKQAEVRRQKRLDAAHNALREIIGGQSMGHGVLQLQEKTEHLLHSLAEQIIDGQIMGCTVICFRPLKS